MESASSTAVDTAAAPFAGFSFVSRAKTVLHSAAARAEKVFTEIKADLKNDRDVDGPGKKDFKKMEDPESAGIDGFNEARQEIFEVCSTEGQCVNNLFNKLAIPPASVLKQLAAAYVAGKNFICSKNLLSFVDDPLPTKEKTGLSFSAVKSLVVRERDDNSFSDYSDDDGLHSKIQFLFDSVLTGSFGVGCSQLLSDMQAFKAANPGCALEDFIRWYSPPDWTEIDLTCEANDSPDGEGSSRRGRLSKRMQKEGNLWQELWKSAKALPAVQQTPVFDEDLAVESIFTALEDIRPSELFGQLFVSMLCSAFTIAEASISPDSNVSKIFYECKDWVITTCQNGISSDNIGDICKVYETVETIISHPEEAITILDQAEKTAVNEESKHRFKRINLNFMKKDMNLLRKKPSKEEKKSVEKQMHVFSQFFDKKSLFSKKEPKLKRASNSEPTLEANDWTIV